MLLFLQTPLSMYTYGTLDTPMLLLWHASGTRVEENARTLQQPRHLSVVDKYVLANPSLEAQLEISEEVSNEPHTNFSAAAGLS